MKSPSATSKNDSLGFKNPGFEKDSAKNSPKVCVKVAQSGKNFTNISSTFQQTLKNINHQSRISKEDGNNNNKDCSPRSYPDVLADTVKKDKDRNKDIKVEEDDDTFWKQTKETFKNFYFLLLLLNGALFLFGSSIVFTHIIAYAESQGISATLAKVMVTLLGVASLLGKIGLGFISQKDGVNTILLYIAAVFTSGECGSHFCATEYYKLSLAWHQCLHFLVIYVKFGL